MKYNAVCVVAFISMFLGTPSDAMAIPFRFELAKPQFVQLELQNTGDALRIAVLNSSDRLIKVNKRFSYGSEVGWFELAFVVKDEHGTVRGYVMKTTSSPPEEEDWCYLWPNQFVGSDIPLRQIRADFGLVPGRYTIEAEYLFRSNAGTIVSRIDSELVTVILK